MTTPIGQAPAQAQAQAIGQTSFQTQAHAQDTAVRLDVPPPPDIPRLTASTPVAVDGPAPPAAEPVSGSSSSAEASMRGLLPWPMSQFHAIPVYSLCFEPPPRAKDSASPMAIIPPMPCPLISHFPSAAGSSPSSSKLSSVASVPSPPTTSSHASALDFCTSRACRETSAFAQLNAQTLEKYPWVVDQGIRAAAAGGARDACALASCPHAYHAYTATVCVPLTHAQLQRRGATLDKPPPGTRPDLAALLEAHTKAPDRNVAQGLGVCLSAMPLGSACNPDVAVVDTVAITGDTRQPPVGIHQGNGTLAAARLPDAFRPPAWAMENDIMSEQDLVSGTVVDGQLFVSSLWPIPRKTASTLPPGPRSPTSPQHPIWAPVYSLTTCLAANKTTAQAFMPGEPCTSTAQCAMSMCVNPLTHDPINARLGNITGQCSRRWMTKAQLTVPEPEYLQSLAAAQRWENAIMWITMAVMFPALLLLMWASMCGTERLVKRFKERRRHRAAKRFKTRSKRSPNVDEAVDELHDALPLHTQPSRGLSSLERAQLEQLRLYQEIAMYMRGVEPASTRPKPNKPTLASTGAALSPAHQHTRTVISPHSSRPSSATMADSPTPPTSPNAPLPIVLTTPAPGSLPRPIIPARTTPPGPSGSLAQVPASQPMASHVPRPRRAAPAVTPAVPTRPVIPPRQQNASIAGIPLRPHAAQPASATQASSSGHSRPSSP